MTPKSDFLVIEAGKITLKESMNNTNFGKTLLLVEHHYEQVVKDYKQQVLVYRLLESTKDLRSISVGHIQFKKLKNFPKFIEIYYCCLKRLRNKK